MNDALNQLESALSELHPGFESDRALHEHARALSIAYTEGAAISPDAAASVAYLAHFGPRTIVSITHAWEARGKTPVAHAVDVGAGSGASALALLSLGAKHVTLVERNRAALARARQLLARFAGRVSFVEGAAGSARVESADMLASAFTFGELATASSLEPAGAFDLLAKTAPRAHTFLLVDAGDRLHARRLQALRDHIVTVPRTPALRIAGPCPHHDACPALPRERDWCHDRVEKHLPPKLARFADRVGRDSERMSLAWLVLVEESRTEAREDAVVVIGDPHVEKGRVRLPVCGPGGVRFLVALKRHRDAHKRLRALDRGSRLGVEVLAGERNTTGDTVRVESPI